MYRHVGKWDMEIVCAKLNIETSADFETDIFNKYNFKYLDP